jgi:hypothetical protein
MHVALGRPEFLISSNVLNRLRRCALHRQVRAEGVPQDMDAVRDNPALRAARLT